MAWSKPMTERLVSLRQQGLSAGQIAERLNAEFEVEMSRNAVIGRMARLQLLPPPVRLSQPGFAVDLGEVRMTIRFERIATKDEPAEAG